MSLRYITLFFTCFFLSCSKNIGNTGKRDICIGFRCYIRESTTKSSYIFPYGNSALIYVCKNGVTNSFTGGTPVYATAYTQGLLLCNKEICLNKDVYDFYSISLNNSTLPDISFSEGQAKVLSNGEDYLWAATKCVDIYGDMNIYLEYRHIACRMTIELAEGSRVTNITVNSVRFTYPMTTGVSLDLSTGNISAATSVCGLSSVAGEGNSRTFLCLPCTAPWQVEINFNATIDGQSVSRTYCSSIDQDLAGGNSYHCLVKLNPDNSFSSSCETKEWTPISNNITY